jgi:hypothetical protein
MISLDSWEQKQMDDHEKQFGPTIIELEIEILELENKRDLSLMIIERIKLNCRPSLDADNSFLRGMNEKSRCILELINSYNEGEI